MSFKGLRLMIIAMFLVCLVANISFAQTEWEKYEGNPVFSGYEGDDSIVIKDGAIYKMWYEHGDDIHYATSPDGISWTPYSGNPVIVWDGEEVEDPHVIKDGDTYRMWYQGNGIGYATSPDGVNWTKYTGNPVLTPGPPGSWDEGSLGSPSVIKDGNTYKMWYWSEPGIEDATSDVGYATSDDGINWTKYSGNPVVHVGGNGDPFVIKNGDIYEMWYETGSSINYASSIDGMNWNIYTGNPVLTPGPNGSWDEESVGNPSVIKEGNIYKMWYEAGKVIGYATSEEVVNNPPSALELVYPADGQTGLGTTEEFRWKKSTDPDGDTVSYDLYVCKDESLTIGCVTKEDIASLKNKDIFYAGTGVGLLLFGVVLAGGVIGRRKIALLIAMIMIAVMIAVSCGGGDGNGDDGAPSDEVSYTVSGLSEGTIYYWKVIAKDGNGGETESEIRSFTTQ